ncbi:MAG TPA: hypothetical protein VLJ58_03440, partial [Ramlibacter sp.]|nr:hypothetical protein [Ramlibacter sp.]
CATSWSRPARPWARCAGRDGFIYGEACGAVEIVATLLQMRAGRLHATRNLLAPIDPELNWVRYAEARCSVHNALTLSFGFGGVNSALCLWRL